MQTPWYRQPMVWMLIFFPLSAVIAGLITLWLAIVSDDGLVADDYYWRGKQINRTLARDATARDYGLQASVRIVEPGATFSVNLDSRYAVNFPEELDLEFLHATRAGQDKVVTLAHAGGGEFSGQMPELSPGNWHLQLSTPQWRVLGRAYLPGADGLVLAPAAN